VRCSAVGCVDPLIRPAAKSADYGAIYKEEKCLVNALNQVLNTPT